MWTLHSTCSWKHVRTIWNISNVEIAFHMYQEACKNSYCLYISNLKLHSTSRWKHVRTVWNVTNVETTIPHAGGNCIPYAGGNCIPHAGGNCIPYEAGSMSELFGTILM